MVCNSHMEWVVPLGIKHAGSIAIERLNKNGYLCTDQCIQLLLYLWYSFNKLQKRERERELFIKLFIKFIELLLHKILQNKERE